MSLDYLPPTQLQQFRELSSCIVASAIETFDIRMQNAGFTNSDIRCIFEDLPRTVGYAATARIRSVEPPMVGRSYYERHDWWNHVRSIPVPRIIVIEDMDGLHSSGAFVGEVHANILRALGCIALVTNGGVRDIPQVRRFGFQLFARNISVSHAYAHVFDFGVDVQVGGMAVRPGDLLHGDVHGIQTVPSSIASQVPEVARRLLAKRARLVECCHSQEFSIERLRSTMETLES